MNIRKCEAFDIKRAASFYDDFVLWMDKNNVNYPKWIYRVYPSEEYVREKTLAGEQYILEDNGELIGAFVLNDTMEGKFQKANWSRPLKKGEYMVLHTLAIAQKCQGQGLGAEVVRFCVKKAKTEKYKAIRLDIVPNNLPARKLYEKNGFKCAGEVDLELGIPDLPLLAMYELNF